MCHSAGAAGAMRKLLWPGFFLLGSLWWSTESHTAVSGHLPAFPPGVRWRKPGTPSSKPPPPPKKKAAPDQPMRLPFSITLTVARMNKMQGVKVHSEGVYFCK